MKKNMPQVKQDHKDTAVSKNADVKKKVLFVDDDAAIRDVLSIIFERAGFDLEVKEGATDILKNKFTLPDLFLIDKQLSGYNGLDLCRHLKEKKKTALIPVIMISASPDIAALSREAGADDYIEKPFNVNFLVSMTNFYIDRQPDIQGDHKKTFRELSSH
jgi:DNA-binding response OmpR family regulator